MRNTTLKRLAEWLGLSTQPSVTEAPTDQTIAAILGSQSAEGWAVFDDVLDPDVGLIDHVLAGPSGVIVVKEEVWSVPVRVIGGRLHRSTRDIHKDVEDVTAVVASLQDLLPTIPVEGMLVFAGDEVGNSFPPKLNGTRLVHVAALRETLNSLNPTLTDPQLHLTTRFLTEYFKRPNSV